MVVSEMDPYKQQKEAAERNYTNQCNPNNQKTGPGRSGSYQGDRSQTNLDNHANQKNPQIDQQNKK